jgi:NAD-dependent SIR2 family protein deacetylase
MGESLANKPESFEKPCAISQGSDPETNLDRVQVEALAELLCRHPRLVALTGAGVSAGSGIPTYRDDDGRWQRSDPIQHQDFVSDAASRQRYWARSMAGFRFVAGAQPNAAHHALAALEKAGHVDLLITQNVDRLHQRAGHQSVVDLHGRLDKVLCLECGARLDRSAFQRDLEALNADYANDVLALRPDGDAEVADERLAGFRVPACSACGGVMMPDVVFFGGTVPAARVERAMSALEAADALLVAGSSLMVYSGFRFCRLAVKLGKPLIVINRGSTRADDIATLKVKSDCGAVLEKLAARLTGGA